jgi:uncharacterized membrane protein YkvA (DUF1232 family)
MSNQPNRFKEMNFSIQSLYNWYRGLLQNPKYRWWVVLASVAYIVSPIDISPDFIPVIGWIDDSVVIGLLVAELSQVVSAKLKERSTRVNDPTKTGATPEPIDINAVQLD